MNRLSHGDGVDPVPTNTPDLRKPIGRLRRLIAALLAHFTQMVTDIDWDLVAPAVRRRMDQLALTQTALSELTGVSALTIRRLLGLSRREADADGFRRDTLVKVSTALGWGSDGLVRIGRGEDPDVVEADAAMGDQSDVAEMLRAMQAQLDRIEAELSRRREDRDEPE